jgi:hypothetical protein
MIDGQTSTIQEAALGTGMEIKVYPREGRQIEAKFSQIEAKFSATVARYSKLSHRGLAVLDLR